MSSPTDTTAAPLAFLIGPTASGKTALSFALAEASEVPVEILSMDSMLVYRGLDVGTAKPTTEERARVPHHLVDLVDPSERYDVQRYLADFEVALAAVRARGHRPLVVGGTGFYLQALAHGLFDGPPVDVELRARLQERTREVGHEAMHAELARIDPASAARIHPNDEKRVLRALEVFEQTGRTMSAMQTEWSRDAADPARGRARRIVGVRCDEPLLTARIRERTSAMLGAGWPEEAARVRASTGFGTTAIQALGYREVLDLVDGFATRAETEERVALRTRQFARRQRTWFRRFPETTWVAREGVGEALASLDWA